MVSINRKIIWLTVFSIAMGYMETAVVVYLRKIYYPGGFQFPLFPIGPDIELIEFLREAATITMLLGIGLLTGKTTAQKFAFFIYCFAIWDLCYYVFLKLLLNWPESLFTWDILFLIPVPWVGPVIVPCIVSLTMIVLTLFIIYFQEKRNNAGIQLKEWLLLGTGSCVIIISFVLDYFKHVIKKGSANNIWALSDNQALFSEIHKYVPSEYNWGLFFLGEALIILGIVRYVRRNRAGS